MRKGSLAIVALAVSVMTGCATSKKAVPEHAEQAQVKGFELINYSHNRLAVAERSAYLAGAGCNGKGVVHVVDINPCPAHCANGSHPPLSNAQYKRPQDVPPKKQDVPPEKQDDKMAKAELDKDYSDYDLGRWQRYCAGGKLMTYGDWDFILKHGGDKGIPDTLSKTCRKPDFNYADYLDAWKTYCSKPGKVDLTENQKHILKTTQVRPKPVVGSCYNKP